VGSRERPVTTRDSGGGRRASFPRSRRLRKRGDFARPFQAPERLLSTPYWTLLATAGKGEARLGIAVPKKRIRKAVDRNRLKRIVRESFRRQHGLPPLDIVIVAKAAAVEAESGVLREALEQLWQGLRMAPLSERGSTAER